MGKEHDPFAHFRAPKPMPEEGIGLDVGESTPENTPQTSPSEQMVERAPWPATAYETKEEIVDGIHLVPGDKIGVKEVLSSFGYQTKDSGERQKFDTGAVRDTRSGKGRFDLIPPMALHRLAGVYERGAAKYGDNNWQKGIPLSRYYDSALRHMMAVREGLEDEDHIFQAVWNMVGFAWTQRAIREGRLPKELGDVP